MQEKRKKNKKTLEKRANIFLYYTIHRVKTRASYVFLAFSRVLGYKSFQRQCQLQMCRWYPASLLHVGNPGQQEIKAP